MLESAVALEVRTKAPEGVVKARLDRALADVEDSRRLLERQAMEVVEDDDGLVLRRQLGDTLADDLAKLGLLGPSAGSCRSSGTVWAVASSIGLATRRRRDRRE